ncbi:hypothetical protein V493_05814 [Pseudogymnoascus sp. VKM F-4281 (FW-2241)]|nr:hypothetical protein V493_05814 [Pseudogymnoascus sp. VKM F-4281 (FW-2241)]
MPPHAPAPGHDDIYPLFMLDDSKTLRSIIVTWTLRFNDVLSPDLLHTSLTHLLTIGDWRKLSGRLRLNTTTGALELHVPSAFTPEHPAVSYSHTEIPCAIADHPLGSTLPAPTPTASLQRGAHEFREFEARADAPKTLEDYLNSDAPQLALHITSFDDATLVALTWPHTLMDVMGQQALLRAWSLVLAGREGDVPALLGAREDVLLSLPDPKDEDDDHDDQQQQLQQRKRLQGFGMFMFGLRFLSGLLWNRVVESRTIFLPKAAVANLRAQAQEDLNGEFISEGDVLTAWATRAVASSTAPRPVTVLHALNLRFRLPSLIHAAGVHVQNLTAPAFAFFTPEMLRGPLGPIALENRRHLVAQTREKEVRALLGEMRSEYTPGCDTTVLCGESDALLMPFTNWGRADIYRAADFAPAVVRAGEVGEGRLNPSGSMVYQHANSMHTSTTMRNVVVVYGRDHGDNYWLSGFLLPEAWRKIEEEIGRL